MRNIETTILPSPPPHGDEITAVRSEDMTIYSKFISHLPCVPNTRTDIKILSSIQFTADMLGYSDAHVAKVLVDLGLRASRAAFPASFLDYADNALLRTVWDIGAPSSALKELDTYWVNAREERFGCMRTETRWLDEHIRSDAYQSL